MEWAEVVEFLRRRQGMLDGVVFSGGEPLIDQALPSALQQVKALGFKTGIHTGGAWPQRLKALLQQDLLDWVGLDIKHLRDKYSQVTGVKASGRAAFASLDIVVESDIAHEVRTTVDPTVHGTEDIVTLIAALRQYRTANGNRIHNHVIQEARPVGAAANNAEAFEDWRLACLLPADVEPSTLRRAA
jgi:pyruvate formate lyase activating enzyme